MLPARAYTEAMSGELQARAADLGPAVEALGDALLDQQSHELLEPQLLYVS